MYWVGSECARQSTALQNVSVYRVRHSCNSETFTFCEIPVYGLITVLIHKSVTLPPPYRPAPGIAGAADGLKFCYACTALA